MEHKLVYSSEANCFEQALPLGNGTLGATVYGKCVKERISLNHDTLWSGKPRLIKKEGAKDSYEQSRQLVLEGKMKEAGVRKGFIILKANGQAVKSVEQLEEIVKQASRSAEPVLFLNGIFPSGKRTYYAVDLTQE